MSVFGVWCLVDFFCNDGLMALFHVVTLTVILALKFQSFSHISS